jgi:hypothetical protein
MTNTTMTFEIPQPCWGQFCEKAGRQPDVLLDIHTEADGDLRLSVKAARLESMAFEIGDACNSSLIINFDCPEEGRRQHWVIEPIRLILRKESASDRYSVLEVPSESGTTVMTFKPGISPALLAELKAPQISPAPPAPIEAREEG